MRRPVIAGNWKMYKTQAEARAYFAALAPLVANSTHCDIIVAPPFTALTSAVESARGTAISIAAQDLCWEAEGAFTGQVSASMLVDVGCRVALVAHSEIRQFCAETDERACKKVKMALAAGFAPVLLGGGMVAQRGGGKAGEGSARQISGGG